MTSGVSLSEILLVLALIVIFVDAKQIPGLIRKSMKIVAQARASIKKFLDDIEIK
jgi:Sec-independent protein translocase protein TatA